MELPDIEGKLFLTVDEVARICRTDPRTIRRAIGSGEVQARRFGRTTRIPVSEVMTLLGAGASAPVHTADGSPHSGAA